LGRFGNILTRGFWDAKNPLTPENYATFQGWNRYSNEAPMGGMNYNQYLSHWNALRDPNSFYRKPRDLSLYSDRGQAGVDYHPPSLPGATTR
jgi:hypothetical protein